MQATSIFASMNDDYLLYRGKCKEMAENACCEDSTLNLVRGYYFCPIWNSDEPHWWTVRQDGSIYDPSKKQFPSKGNGIYTPFNGMVNCSNCGKEMKEEEASYDSNYCFCSNSCYGRFVGVY
jgi:hypothetical protein